jgi:hypothetical protein
MSCCCAFVALAADCGCMQCLSKDYFLVCDTAVSQGDTAGHSIGALRPGAAACRFCHSSSFAAFSMCAAWPSAGWRQSTGAVHLCNTSMQCNALGIQTRAPACVGFSTYHISHQCLQCCWVIKHGLSFIASVMHQCAVLQGVVVVVRVAVQQLQFASGPWEGTGMGNSAGPCSPHHKPTSAQSGHVNQVDAATQPST